MKIFEIFGRLVDINHIQSISLLSTSFSAETADKDRDGIPITWPAHCHSRFHIILLGRETVLEFELVMNARDAVYENDLPIMYKSIHRVKSCNAAELLVQYNNFNGVYERLVEVWKNNQSSITITKLGE